MTDKHGLYSQCFKLSECLSLLFLSLHVDLERALTYTPKDCCDVGSCFLCPCVNSRTAESRKGAQLVTLNIIIIILIIIIIIIIIIIDNYIAQYPLIAQSAVQ